MAKGVPATSGKWGRVCRTGADMACARILCAQVVGLWREDLSKINAKAAESLADPEQYPNLFPNLDLALHAETYQVRSASHALHHPWRGALLVLPPPAAWRCGSCACCQPVCRSVS